MHISWARLASFCHLGVISDPLIVSKFHNETHDPKGQENKIFTIVKGRETFYRRHTVPVTSCSEVKYVLKRVSFGSKDCTKELKPKLTRRQHRLVWSYTCQNATLLEITCRGLYCLWCINYTEGYRSQLWPWIHRTRSNPGSNILRNRLRLSTHTVFIFWQRCFIFCTMIA